MPERFVSIRTLSAVACLLLLMTGTATLQQNEFVPTGSMTVPRIETEAVRLANGMVLVAGGADYDGGWSQVDPLTELYDPATGTFVPTGNLTLPRFRHQMTLLPSGEVLVTGGYITRSLSATDSGEIYDPSTGSWTPVVYMTAGRAEHSATLLPNGKVLIAGGARNGNALQLAELYDLATQDFVPTGPMTAARMHHTATLLPNGKVLVAGGRDGATLLDSAELYDPSTGTFSPTDSMAEARNFHTATLLPNGNVLVAGSWLHYDPFTTLASTEVYDWESGLWELPGPDCSMTVPRGNHSAILLHTGFVLIAGGADAEQHLSSAELYDPRNCTTSAISDMRVRAEGRAMATLTDGKVLIAGGGYWQAGWNILELADLYDPGPPPNCNGRIATTSGPPGFPLVGTPFNDVLVGRTSGTIRGMNGHDWICGGNSGTVLGGGSGNDVLIGGASNDTFSCASGNDIAFGGPGTDQATADCEVVYGMENSAHAVPGR